MHFENSIITDLNSIKKPARLKQQQMILELFNYHICDAKIRRQLETKALMAANHIPINAKIISANEHESHYVFDVLYNNTTDIKPDIHYTDTHGANEVNFSILNFFGYQFAPRYKDIYDKR